MKIKYLLALVLMCVAFAASATVVQLYYGPDKDGKWAVYFFYGDKMYDYRYTTWIFNGESITFANTISRFNPDALDCFMKFPHSPKDHPMPERINDDGTFVYRFADKKKTTECYYTFASDFSILTIEDSIRGTHERLPLYTYFAYLEAGEHYNVGPPDKRPGDIRTAARALALRKGRITDHAAEVDTTGQVPYDDSAPALSFPQLDGMFSAEDSLQIIHNTAAANAGKIPQEMVYLHLDNTSYYRGDSIFFAGYLVHAADMRPSRMSETVYVQLLNPGGKIIDHCVLRVDDGCFHGSLVAQETPFYSGYYEVRAYSRYMLNFGPEAMYSRVIPIFHEPEDDGDWTDRRMVDYGEGRFVYNRPRQEAPDSVTLKFYPEGGHLVKGLPATVGFELTDRLRRPLQGEVTVGDTSVIADEQGRGRFRFVPDDTRRRATVKIGKNTYFCDLPEASAEGIALHVDNFSHADSVLVSVRRTDGFPMEAVGLTLSCRGMPYGAAILDLSADATVAATAFARANLPTGVMQLTMFAPDGRVLADRLFFNNRNDIVNIEYQFDKEEYGPCAPVEMTLTLPAFAQFSLSVTDADDELPYGSNIMADMLLASEIKGYVHNPAWYFDEPGRETELDNLLLIQGWRKYSWAQLTGLKPYRVEYLPEKGVEVIGRVIGRWTRKPKADIDVMAWVSIPEHPELHKKQLYTDGFRTDSNGRFCFRTDICDTWGMTLGTARKGKPRNHHIMLNRNRRIKARGYDFCELQTGLEPRPDENAAAAQGDSARATVVSIPGVKFLKEVEVIANGLSHEREIGLLKENAVAGYDITEEYDALQDEGVTTIRYLTDLLPMINDKFRCSHNTLTYADKRPLFVLDDAVGDNATALTLSDLDYVSPLDVPIEAINHLYINEQPTVIADYAIRYTEEYDLHSRMTADRNFGCVVFVELLPEKIVEVGAGMRRTTLEAYTPAAEFYSPDYDGVVPIATDRRRTLYWDPDVHPDYDGIARVRFYNNSTARKFNVTTATFPLL